MKITELLKPESIALGISAGSKDDVINQLVSLMENGGRLNDKAGYKEGILAREALGSTAIGEGIAIPHAKVAAVKEPGLAAVVAPDGVDYEAFDGSLANLIFMIADKAKVAQTALGALRVKLGRQLNLIDESRYNFLWVTNFPMFEYSEEEQRYVAAHHPFTSPNLEDVDKLMSDPENCYSRAYDLVLNGYELLSGSIRIHDQHVQEKVFEAIGMSMEEAREKFGFFIDAFRYGTPPHGGVGIGLERLVMILAGTDNIRDVVAFPKTASASDLMSEAPNTVDEKQLKELHIALEK